MSFLRPDLTQTDPSVVAYIEHLEAELASLRSEQVNRPSRATARHTVEQDDEWSHTSVISEPTEEPTTINLVSVTRQGIAKRTPRHFYSRQHRSGMGIFDLDAPEDDPPALLTLADEKDVLLCLTSFGRVFRFPVKQIPETPIRARGEPITGKFNLSAGETISVLLPVQAQGYLAALSERGFVRMLRHHVFGEYMKPGMLLFDSRTSGDLVAACWTTGDGDLLIISRLGKGIRFSEKLIPPQGGLALRLSAEDQASGIAGVHDDSAVFLLSADGRGAFRSMEGFLANKAPGAGGKIIMNSDHLIYAAEITNSDDIFIISRLGKLIRFPAEEVPVKEGPVQGVICMSLRSDECVAATHTTTQ